MCLLSCTSKPVRNESQRGMKSSAILRCCRKFLALGLEICKIHRVEAAGSDKISHLALVTFVLLLQNSQGFPRGKQHRWSNTELWTVTCSGLVRSDAERAQLLQVRISDITELPGASLQTAPAVSVTAPHTQFAKLVQFPEEI